jgi:CubicO group peptidase (beta-lactamase class C family)
VSREFEAHSVRKSLVSGLYGTAVARAEIDLDSTLADLDINERTPLAAAERSATIGQLISARSGVYLPAAYGASQAKGRPRRGSRFGQLYMQQGHWAGRQILPAAWVEESTRPHTDDGDGTGYGYMWWTYRAGSPFTARYPTLGKHTFYRALGTGEQGLWVIPDAELVVVHRADTDHGRRVDGEDHWALVESIMAARRTEPQPEPDLSALRSSALASQLPPAAIPEYRALAEDIVDDYLGDYQPARGATSLGEYKLTPGAPVRVFLFDDNPYVHLPGVGDVQIFPTARRDTFSARAVLGMGLAFERTADGEVCAVTLTLGDSTLGAARAPRR